MNKSRAVTCVLVVLALSLLSVLPSTATSRAAPIAATSPLVTAFAQRGWVYALRSDGSTLQVTAGTNAVDPLLSPNRSTVAYFTVNRPRKERYGATVLNGVWTVGIRANRQILVASLYGEAAGALAWSPNGRFLAYLHGREVGVWRGPGGGSQIVARLSREPALGSAPAMAWSPDSRQIAVPLAPVSLQQPPVSLSLAIVDVPTASSRVVTVRFPQRLMGSRTTALGWHPTSNQIGWSSDGGSLLVATVVNGAGNSLSGIWTVSKGGGMAHLMYGNPAHVARGATPALTNATHFLISPGGNRMATDPGRRFWVTALGGVGGQFLAPRQAANCTIAQWGWLVGGHGLAYVSLCTVGGTTNFRSTLSTASLQTGHSRPIVTLLSPTMTVLSLAPAVRCLACG